ncbi:cytochrome P450 2J5-like [Podarcis lilfordi]|uniref:Cytochrome P450 2J5-like n=1 Tax=Podarcis lilfordi TaxID=74358 RepID=A0AA35KEL0_9SAUR|nr:cytochrome P450 2J5-like [Podarcis lilfordi]
MESGIKEDKETLENNMDEGLPEQKDEMVELEATDGVMKKSFTKGTALSNGHSWRQQRRFVVVSLQKLWREKKGMEHQIAEEAHQLVEVFARSKGHPLDPSMPITNSVSNVICAVAFGHQFALEGERFQKLMEAMDFLLKFISSFVHAVSGHFHSY